LRSASVSVREAGALTKEIEVLMAHSRSAALALLFSSFLIAEHLVAAERKPQSHDLVLVRLMGADEPEYVFEVGELRFRSVAALKSFVQSLPEDSVIRWAPGCMRFGDEPLLSSDAAMEDFRSHCSRYGVKLVLVPSG
jgi:hypothetical protein